MDVDFQPEDSDSNEEQSKPVSTKVSSQLYIGYRVDPFFRSLTHFGGKIRRYDVQLLQYLSK